MNKPEARKHAHLGMTQLPLWWIRNEFPAWGHVYELAGLGFRSNARWADVGWREITLKDSKCRVWLDLSSAFERGTFFLGRYQELELELIMRAAIGPGDQFIDGGANIGLLSLLAASIVGPAGVVHAFEPNEAVYRRIEEHFKLNDLSQAVLHKVGLSDRPEELRFRILDGGPESGTLADLSDQQMDAVTTELIVNVQPGDELLFEQLSPAKRTMLKLDVEGFETQAVRGLAKTIDRLRPVITTEYQQHLTKDEDVAALFEIMMERDYAAWLVGLRRTRGFSHELRLDPIANAEVMRTQHEKCDVLWLAPEARDLYQDAFTGA